MQVEGIQRHFPFRRGGGWRRGGGGSGYAGCGGRGWGLCRTGLRGDLGLRFRLSLRRRPFGLHLQPHVALELVCDRRFSRRHAAQLLQLGDDVLPIQMFVRIAAHMNLRRPQADFADIKLACNRLQFKTRDRQRTPGGQAVASGVMQIKAAQAKVTHHADFRRRVLGLLEHDLKIGIQQRAVQFERQRHRPYVRPLFQLQAVEGHAQGR